MLSPDLIADIVAHYRTMALELDNAYRLEKGPYSESLREQLGALTRATHEQMRNELARGDHSRVEPLLEAILRQRGATLDAFERRQVGQALLLSAIQAQPVMEARYEGDFSSGFPSIPREPGSVETAIAAPPIDRVVQKRAAPALSAIAPKFLAEQRAGKIWDEQTARQAEKSVELFVELAGDKPVASYGRKDAGALKTLLQKLPADYGKATVFRGRPLSQIVEIDAARKPSVQRLSTRTVKRHFSALSSFWRWLGAEGLAVENPFQGFTFPSTKRANEQRDMWQEEELRVLFESPIWSGCESEVHRSRKGDLIIRDEKFWLPLIAVFSGMRQEEICQLQVEDIRQIEGYWLFDINARPPRKLKNRNAIRRVPIHSELQRLGLLSYVDEQRSRSVTALFPNLAPGGADGRLGHSYSKWFARYRQAVGLYRKGLDFHSFRHTATTMLQRAGVPIGTIDELTGHASPGETARYTHGLSVRQL